MVKVGKIGVVLAVFGCIVVVYAVMSPVSLTATNAAGTETVNCGSAISPTIQGNCGTVVDHRAEKTTAFIALLVAVLGAVLAMASLVVRPTRADRVAERERVPA